MFGTYQKFFEQSDGASDGLFRNSLDRAVREQEVGRAAQDNSDRRKGKFGKHKTKGHINRRMGVSQFGPVVRPLAGKQKDLGSIPLWLSFLYKSGIWTLSCDFALHS